MQAMARLYYPKSFSNFRCWHGNQQIIETKFVWVGSNITASSDYEYKHINQLVFHNQRSLMTWCILQNVFVSHIFVNLWELWMIDCLHWLTQYSIYWTVSENTAVSCSHCISLLLGCMGVSEIMASAFILKSPLQKLLLWCQVMVSDDNTRVFWYYSIYIILPIKCHWKK